MAAISYRVEMSSQQSDAPFQTAQSGIVYPFTRVPKGNESKREEWARNGCLDEIDALRPASGGFTEDRDHPRKLIAKSSCRRVAISRIPGEDRPSEPSWRMVELSRVSCLHASSCQGPAESLNAATTSVSCSPASSTLPATFSPHRVVVRKRYGSHSPYR